ncbi:MAG: CPBP family intramembrane glutamic endopeptidase, partial [Candidatus Omnitrophota bacterium]|nr:CPBP family intramembrane glutamic endopeptidase [Candidatus Omnitrophota bacterium]
MISPDKIFYFLKREKLYVFLLVFVMLFHASFSLLNRPFEDNGAVKLFEERKFEKIGFSSGEKIEEVFDSRPILYLALVLFIAVFILFFVIGLVVDIIFLYLNRKNKIVIGRTRLIEPVRWGLWDICKVAIIFLFAQSVLWLTDVFFLSAAPCLQSNYSLKLMLLATALDITAIAAVFYFVLKEKRQSVDSLGLTTKRFFLNLKYGVAGYIGLLPSLALIMFLTMVTFKMFNIPVEPQPVVVILEKEKHIPSLIYLCLFTGFFGPVMEEIFFRGFIYGVLKKKAGIFGGIIISASFFACIHAN